MSLMEQIIQDNKDNKDNNSLQKTHRFNYTERHKYSFYVDLETTGGDAIRNSVIEICCLVTEKDKFDIIDKFHSYVRPQQINHYTWSPYAEEIHGITKQQARNFPKSRKVAYDFLLFCDKYRDREQHWPQLFVCHAAKQSFFNSKTNEKVWGLFDFRFLEWFFRKEGDAWYYAFNKVFNDSYCLSTISMAEKHGYGKDQLVVEGKPQYTKTGRPKKEGNGLAMWAKRIGFDLKHHEAESDTECCLRVHEYLESQ